LRLWTVHPRYLDAKGLVALWREALLAQQVLLGRTKGYRHHPQLDRFRAQPDPPGAIAAYLEGVLRESVRRGYRFDGGKIIAHPQVGKVRETRGQLLYEWKHLAGKLRRRSPGALAAHRAATPSPHPLFRIVAGRRWERGRRPGAAGRGIRRTGSSSRGRAARP